MAWSPEEEGGYPGTAVVAGVVEVARREAREVRECNVGWAYFEAGREGSRESERKGRRTEERFAARAAAFRRRKVPWVASCYRRGLPSVAGVWERRVRVGDAGGSKRLAAVERGFCQQGGDEMEWEECRGGSQG